MKNIMKGILLVLGIGLIVFTTKIIVEKAISNRQSALDNSLIVNKNDLLIGYQSHSDVETIVANEYRLPVPLFNQRADPPLEYGCEVTALSMILQYYHLDYDKNDLAEKIKKEPYQYNSGEFGDPDIGFVGDMTGEKPGSGVNVGPIYDLANELVEEPYEVFNSTGTKVDELLEIVQNGSPVWTIVSTDYEVPNEKDFIDWPTKNGMKKFLPKHHSAVIIGFSPDKVFLNDPYGLVQEVEREKFEQLFEKMGKQSLYIK